jgi:hypothetical protein
MDKQTLVDKLTAKDKARPRSQQTAIGVSQLGSCRRKVWLQLQGTPETNPTSSLAAIMGTAIHASIEDAFGDQPDILIEHRVEIDNYPPATIDYFDKKSGEVVDWKTTKKSNLAYFPSNQQRWQVQVYGHLMTLAGFEVNQVTLVAIARDGDEDDIKIHSEAYDPAVAVQAFAWLDEVKNMTDAPAPEKDAATFCKKYCGFYGSACTGIGKDYAGDVITDDVATAAADRYLELQKQIKALEAEQDAAKQALLGVSGVTFTGVTVKWAEVAGRQTPDMDVIKSLLPDVPMKQGAPSLRLTVK